MRAGQAKAKIVPSEVHEDHAPRESMAFLVGAWSPRPRIKKSQPEGLAYKN